MKRFVDCMLVLFACLMFALPALLIALAIKFTSSGPILYWSDRIGLKGKVYRMPKFRTMYVNTPVVATDLLSDPNQWLTPVGGFLRKLSLDEIPQLWNILVGEMSFVGPRPALFNQHELIAAREQLGIHELLPGLTGWAQVNGRDDLSDEQKVAYDYEYLQRQSFLWDMKIIFLTALKVVQRDGVAH